MIRSLAVTTDFSEASRAAFGPATDLARTFEARLSLVHLEQGPQLFTPWQLVPEPAEAARRRITGIESRLQDLARRDPALQRSGVRVRLLSGELPEALSRFIHEEAVDLLVVATHGRSGLKTFPLGSFTAKLLRFVPCSVLVFRGVREETKQAAGFAPRRILAPHDFSMQSLRSVRVACEWARKFGAEARILTVVEPYPEFGGNIDPEAADGARSGRIEEEVRDRLERLVSEEWKGVAVQTAVRRGHPVAEILKEAERYRPDLVAMGNSGLSVADRLKLGSTTERTIQGAHCPVLVVRLAD